MLEEWLRRLAALPTAALSDVMRRRGMDPRTMHSSMKPVWEGAEVCGPAFTARTYPGATHASGLALSEALPGRCDRARGGAAIPRRSLGRDLQHCRQTAGSSRHRH